MPLSVLHMLGISSMKTKTEGWRTILALQRPVASPVVGVIRYEVLNWRRVGLHVVPFGCRLLLRAGCTCQKEAQ